MRMCVCSLPLNSYRAQFGMMFPVRFKTFFAGKRQSYLLVSTRVGAMQHFIFFFPTLEGVPIFVFTWVKLLFTVLRVSSSDTSDVDDSKSAAFLMHRSALVRPYWISGSSISADPVEAALPIPDGTTSTF